MTDPWSERLGSEVLVDQMKLSATQQTQSIDNLVLVIAYIKPHKPGLLESHYEPIIPVDSRQSHHDHIHRLSSDRGAYLFPGFGFDSCAAISTIMNLPNQQSQQQLKINPINPRL